MIRQLFDYKLHRFDPNNFRLVMTLLVKDEEDIIEANIRTHAKLGIDAFVVMDNNSTDGTRELLEKLKNEFEMIIIDEKGLYEQGKWMTKLAFIAKKEFKADWIINNDADEFWLPQNDKSLKDILSFKGNVLTVHRNNMLLEEKSLKDGNFFNASFYVKYPIAYPKASHIDESDISITLTQISPKTIVNPNGLFKILKGNHRAKHLFNLKDYIKAYNKIKKFEDIIVYHYPIRSYRQFEKRVRVANEKMEITTKTGFASHMQRWAKIYKNGKLEEEFYKNIVFNEKELSTLKKYSIIGYNPNIYKKIIQ